MNRLAFYRGIEPLFKQFSFRTLEGIEAILAEWDKRHLIDLRWLAYILATAYHETAHTMRPVEEWGKGKGRKYSIPDPVTGKVYYGRGHVQLTWADNYRRMGEIIGVDLYNYPEKALVLENSIQILFEGMIRGSFTGKKLADFLNEKTNWVGARKIVNGVDKAELIAQYAIRFHRSLI